MSSGILYCILSDDKAVGLVSLNFILAVDPASSVCLVLSADFVDANVFVGETYQS